MIRDILRRLTARQELSEADIVYVIESIDKDDIGDAQISSFLTGLLMKGVTVNETVAIVTAMRAQCIPIRPKVKEPLLDTCGTGGGLSTFNISTATAIVCAASGIPVAKHGSRSLSSLSGSADVLEALGLELSLSAAAIERMIEEIGIAFIHAPDFHPVMRRVMPVEGALGIKTVFYTLIGPLINPALATRHLLGVYRPELQDLTAQVASKTGYTRAMVVHGTDGVDEISLLGPTIIHDLNHGQISVYEIAPEQYGLRRCSLDQVKSLEPRANAALITDVFAQKVSGAPRDAIIFNSAGALIVGGRAQNFSQGIDLATDLIESGAVLRKLHEFVEMSHSFEKAACNCHPTRNFS